MSLDKYRSQNFRRIYVFQSRWLQ